MNSRLLNKSSGHETRTGSYLEKPIRYLRCERNNDRNKKLKVHNQCITNGHCSGGFSFSL